jgi:hypothetical protein
MQIKTQVDERPVCASSDHFLNLILDGKCFSCGAVWGLSEEMAEAIDDEQLRHREAPTDQEIDAMYALAGSDSSEYRTAHD